MSTATTEQTIAEKGPAWAPTQIFTLTRDEVAVSWEAWVYGPEPYAGPLTVRTGDHLEHLTSGASDDLLQAFLDGQEEAVWDALEALLP